MLREQVKGTAPQRGDARERNERMGALPAMGAFLYTSWDTQAGRRQKKAIETSTMRVRPGNK